MSTMATAQLTMEAIPKTTAITTTMPKMTATKIFKQMPMKMINTATNTNSTREEQGGYWACIFSDAQCKSPQDINF